MENKNSKIASQNGKQSNDKTKDAAVQTSQLMVLFEDGLKDIYWAEKALTKSIPKLIEKATSQELIVALKSHLAETGKQIDRLEQVFESIDKKAVAKKCVAMDGLLKEAEELMESYEAGAKCDAGIIYATQKVEHYEIATYGTLRQFAETLGLTEAMSLLEATLIEEKAADVKLTKIALSINVEAAEEDADTVVATKTKSK